MKKLIEDIMKVLAGLALIIILIARNTPMGKKEADYLQEIINKLDELFIEYLGKY
jgi:hypothetical protein